MTGRGGGIFYVPILVLAGVSMHESAAVGQLLSVATASVTAVVFIRKRRTDMRTVAILSPPMMASALAGGYLAHFVEGLWLKCLLGALLIVAAAAILIEKRERKEPASTVRMTVLAAMMSVAAMLAASVGIAVGSFLLPALVLIAGMAMHQAIGTTMVILALTAMMGFLGHTAGGDLKSEWAFILPPIVLAGGYLGGKIALHIPSKPLKWVFVISTLVAAILMIGNAILTR